MAATSKATLAPWLLLALWSRLAAALRRWFLRLVRRPLRRLGLGGAPSLRLEADVDSGGDAEDAWDRIDAGSVHLSVDELPLGLVNLDNICFANAVVQCLRMLPGFVERLVADTARTRVEALRDGDDSERAKQWRVADALCDLMYGVAPECTRSEQHGEDGRDPVDSEGNELASESRTKTRDPVARREQNKAMLRYFRQQVSKCSYLVTAAGDEQEQQDAEVGPIATMLSPLQLSDVLSESNRSSCPSCWSCCTTCSAAAMKCSMTSRSVRPSGWSSC
jgi:hypothetical protein